MKRILLFLGLLLTFFVGVNTAWAGSQTIPQLSTDGNMHYYAIKNLRTGKYLYWNGNSDFIRQSELLNGNGFFYFTAGSTKATTTGVTSIKIHNKKTTTMMATINNWTDTGADWYVKAASNSGNTGIAFSNNENFGNKYCWNSYDSENKIGTWSVDGGSIFEVEELTEAQMDFAIKNYAFRTGLEATINRYAPLINAFYGCTEEAYNTALAVYNKYKDATSFTDEDVAEFNQANTTFLATSPINTDIPTGTICMLGNYLHTNAYAYATTTMQKDEAKDSYAYIWKLLKQDNGNYKFYNPYSNKYVGSIPGNNTNTGNDVAIPLVDNEASAQEYTIAAAANLGYVTFKTTQTGIPENRSYLHMGAPGVVRWEATAQASQFKIVTSGIDELAATWNASLTNDLNVKNYVGYKKISDAQKTAYEALTAANNIEAKASKAKALSDATSASTESNVTPEAGKYYTIQCARGKRNGVYFYENYGDTQSTQGYNALQTSSTLDANILPFLWQFEQLTDENKTDRYYIRPANSKNYLSNTVETSYWLRIIPEDNTEKNVKRGEYYLNTASNKVDTPFAVAITDKASKKATGENVISVRNEDFHVVAWDGGNDGSSNNFRIVEVTTIPVNITSAGYATLNLPMAVNIPTDVKAYTGQKEGNELKLTAITTGIIPAETPVVIEGAEGTHNFDINYDNTAPIANNGLNGTLIPTAIDNDATAYVLGNGSKGIAFYKVTSETDRTIGANKAYAGSTTVEATANVLIFNFSDITTGINNAATSQGNDNNYYDLNGRRVLYPAHGIFVKENGQKVFIK